MMYDRILVAIDGSEIALRALAQAVRLAKAGAVTLRLAYGIDTVTFNADSLYDQERRLDSLRRAGRDALEKASVAVREAGVPCEEALLQVNKAGHGRLPELIVQEATGWGAKLVVLGTHARQGVSHLLLGSVAEEIVHMSSRPVLVVPSKAPADSAEFFQRILVAVDDSEVAELALEEAIGLASFAHAALRIVHVTDTSAGIAGVSTTEEGGLLAKAAAKTQRAGIEGETRALVAQGERDAVASAVAAEAAAWPADVIVCGTHGRQGLSRLRLGSVAESILRLAQAPVLLTRKA